MCNAMTLASPRMMWNGIANPMMTATDGRERREDWHDASGRWEQKTDAGGQFSEANEPNQCRRHVRSPRRGLDRVVQWTQAVIPPCRD